MNRLTALVLALLCTALLVGVGAALSYARPGLALLFFLASMAVAFVGFVIKARGRKR
ncbi:hypothetical protein [Paenibacillus sp. y28]|uniref:hypothetical protein n=1 Tax=Paenibacillus sp. y28 TaxID=3129110 RepID=UPI0030185D15